MPVVSARPIVVIPTYWHLSTEKGELRWVIATWLELATGYDIWVLFNQCLKCIFQPFAIE
jgi:hypothetical protein